MKRPKEGKKKRRKFKKSPSDWYFSDTCAICRAMEEGRASTEKELRKVFAEAEKENKDKKRHTIDF